ncbi:MAG TPA: hypothetical protein VHB54_08270 [Mucilaginibacter sp.]|nr:hypothetical protein [Mucilaginibacter sp.]HVW13801.1 hypothetical protein [Mucilaginibacter sp.]
MKKAIFYLLIVSTFLLIDTRSKAQEYKPNYQYAVGLKFGGYENGLSGKYFMTDNTSLEAELGFRSHGLVVTGLYEFNQQAFGVEGFRFFYGFGAHVGGVGPGYYRRFNGDSELYVNNQILLGADGVLGLEYVIPKSPIAVSFDLDPRIELATGPFFDIAPGLGIKYCF